MSPLEKSFLVPVQQAESAPEISFAERELVSKIESLPMSKMDKVTALLVAKGLKPTFLFTFQCKKWPRGEAEPSDDPQQIARLETILQTAELLGLRALHIATFTFEMLAGEYSPVGDHDRSEAYVFAKDVVAAEMVKQEQEKRYTGSETIDEFKLGVALGFPETAARAWNEYEKACLQYREKIRKGVYPRGSYPNRFDYLKNPDEIPEETRQKDFYRFNGFFALSKEHWAEELERVKVWSDEIRRLDSVLHQSCLRDEHR